MTIPTPYYDHDGITIYHGDCREILPEIGRFDLLLTDPPYGINADVFRASLPTTKGKTLVSPIAGDDSLDAVRFIFESITQDQRAVIWGANNFPHLLPHKGRWCCWDKRLTEKADAMLGSAFELAWENRTTGFDVMVRVLHGGVVNADAKRFPRSHPTQKPIQLFRAVVARYNPKTIVDPFMGSGTTLIVAKELRIRAVGIEINERYCDIAIKRLQQGVLEFEDACT